MKAKPQPRKSGSSSLASSLASSVAVITPEEINGPAMTFREEVQTAALILASVRE